MIKSFGQKEKTLSSRSKRKGLLFPGSLLKYSWVLILGFLLTALLFTELALANTLSIIFRDSFEPYTLGNLAGQGDWTDCLSHPGNVLVAGDSPHTGSRFSKLPADGIAKCASRTGNQLITGTQTFWVKPAGGSFAGNVIIGKQVSTSTPLSSQGVFIVHSNNTIMWYPWEGNPIVLCDTGGNYTQLTFSWDATTNKVKYECLGESSGWVDVALNGIIDFDYFDTIRVSGTNALTYVDDISGVCGIGVCDLCETRTECINAGCFWSWAFIIDTYTCSEPTSMECGIFAECQFCETQETCEEGFNCIWGDYGFGLQCYFDQDPLATTTVEWTVPDLDDCEPLSGVEKWLCEIKNFIAGAFLPSQEKIDKLYNILLEFSQKFPFNYINIFKDFLADVEEGIDDTASISIKILGHESNLNFNFWNATTTIGGITESLRNIIVDMTTAVILLTFLVWVVSFLRRFF